MTYGGPKVAGIDVSNNVPPQNWPRLHQEGVRFAFARISEGAHLVDTHAEGHIAGAAAAGMVVGGYHFAWPNESPEEQAAHYVANVRPLHRPGFSHWLDMEPYPDGRNYRGMSSAQIRAWGERWCELVAAEFPGDRVGAYGGNPEWEAGHMPDRAWLTYWLPAYPRRGLSFEEAMAYAQPHAGPHLAKFWQFSGTPDLNLWYGTEAELHAWAGHTPPSPTPTPTPTPGPKPPVGQRARVWVVKRGQWLGMIAAAFGVSVATLAGYNHIANPNVIYPGERVTAPPSRVSTHPTPLPSVSTSRVAYPSTRPTPTSTGCVR